MSSFRNSILAAVLAVSPLVFAGDPVDINSADAAALAQTIDGVGEARARAIIEYRDKNGPFKSVDDLVQVPGIGEKIVAANRDKLTAAAKPKQP